jgi:inosine-uridine nucleoside N-ribohydrolase
VAVTLDGRVTVPGSRWVSGEESRRLVHELRAGSDAVAVGMVLWPDLVTTRKAHVKVIDGGWTVIDESQPPNCEIGMTIQKDEFIRRLMDRLLKQDLRRP